MTEPENCFHEIIKKLPNGAEGKMFGAKCLKAANGKTAALFWEENMVFKLDEKSHKEALSLEGAKIGVHLYDSTKPMKGWVSIPNKYSDKWIDYAQKALKFIE